MFTLQFGQIYYTELQFFIIVSEVKTYSCILSPKFVVSGLPVIRDVGKHQ